MQYMESTLGTKEDISLGKAYGKSVSLNRFNRIDKHLQHERIGQELLELYKSKNHDYGDSFGETYEKLGIISAVTRITDKLNRLQSLSTKEAKVYDETIEDTLVDLANYAIMTLIEIEMSREK